MKNLLRKAIIATVLLVPFLAKGQLVTLKGKENSHAGQELVFYKHSDLITLTEEEVGRCKVSKKGDFSCKIKITETTFIYATLGVYKAYMFAEPGKAYELILPQREDKTEAQRLNPYFRETDLHIGIANISEADINFATSQFDALFNQSFDEIVEKTYKGELTLSIDSIINTIENLFTSNTNSYFHSYRNYRYGLLKQLTLYQKAKSISNEYFLNQPIQYNNTAYMELFNLVYDKYFIHFGRTLAGKAIFDNISQQRSYSALKQTLATDSILANDTLKELVILKSLYGEFFDDEFSRSALLAILDSLYFSTTIPEHLVIAENIRTRVTKMLPGFVPTQFELKDQNGKPKSLNSFKDKYVYLNFCSTTSYTCLQDFVLLKKFYDKHKKFIEVVTICIDNNENDMQVLLKNTGYDWTFLYYGNKPELVKDYDVRAYPTYFLIGPDKKLIWSPAPSPREDVEVRLFNLLRAKGEI
ncbi:MAG: TlpA family protein disulfide reductase [Bacteroidales bacterium]|nr:TlpA family protein disulfide reductase [Bacteroidales bacterium]MBN2748819.1 TlpA family protein disulfide reductase [Bacteroidales bacterium]